MKSTSDFVVWGVEEVRYACRLKTFHGFSSVEMFEEGAPLLDILPSDSHFKMNPDFPFNLLLTDSLFNLHDLVIVSSKEKMFCEVRVLSNVEYLPVTILDHKGRAIKESYFIVHPLHPVDCLDLSASDVVWSEIDTNTIEHVAGIAIDEKKISDSLDIFRIKHLGRVTVIRRKLAHALDSAGFSGNQWIEIDSFSD